MSHVSTLIKYLDAKMGAAFWAGTEGRYTWERASALMFSELGWYAIVNWNLVKKRVQRA